MTDWLGPAMRDAITVIAILLQGIIALLIYIFNLRMGQAKADIDALKEKNKQHEEANKSDLREMADALVALKNEITNLHIVLPDTYVKQTVLAALQMDIKSDMRSVFDRMDELKTMLINMGAERRKG